MCLLGRVGVFVPSSQCRCECLSNRRARQAGNASGSTTSCSGDPRTGARAGLICAAGRGARAVEGGQRRETGRQRRRRVAAAQTCGKAAWRRCRGCVGEDVFLLAMQSWALARMGSAAKFGVRFQLGYANRQGCNHDRTGWDRMGQGRAAGTGGNGSTCRCNCEQRTAPGEHGRP